MATFDNPKVADFLRPDGSVDWDAYLTAELGGDWTTRPARAQQLQTDLRGYQAAQKARATPRVAQALAGAPVVKDIAGLAEGSTAEPAAPDAAAAALEELAGGKKPVFNSEGRDVSKLQPGMPPPRAALPKPLEFDPEAMPNLVESDVAKPTRALPLTPSPDRSSLDVLATLDPAKQRLPAPTPGPEEWAQPFSSSAGNIERPTLAGALSQAREYQRQGGGSPGRAADQLLAEAGSEDPDVAERDMLAAFAGAKRSTALARARAGAAGAVGAMNRDAAAHQQEANIEKYSRGNVELEKKLAGRQPDRTAAKQVLAKLETGGGASPDPERPTFDRDLVAMAKEPSPGAPSARTPLAAAQQLTTGAAPDTTADEEELKAAQKARDEELFLAQIATQFGNYADIVGETKGGDRGAVVRQAAGNKVGDLQAKRQLRADALQRQQDQEDRGLSREVTLESLADKRRKTQESADYNDGASKVSSRRRAMAASMYPQIVAKIPPETFREMSAADIDTLLGEATPQKQVAAGGARGGGMSPSALNTVRGKLPQGLVNTYNAVKRVRGLVDSMGGWDKTKTGIAGGFMPSLFMDPNNQQLRQELGNVVAGVLKSGGGKSITANEERILIGRIAADPTSSSLTPEMLARGLQIIDRALAADTRQALAGVPPESRAALLRDMGIDESWVGQDLAPAQTKRQVRLMRDRKTGEVVEVED